ncbi:hypothetical protein RFI_02113, partial [Reticulomyxa filosa]
KKKKKKNNNNNNNNKLFFCCYCNIDSVLFVCVRGKNRSIQNRNRIESLYLEFFAEKMFQDKNLRISQKLQQIKEEVKQGFRDPRDPFGPIPSNELFHLLTGESEQTLQLGMLVTVEVKSISSGGVKCAFSNGLDAFIPADKISFELANKMMSLRDKYADDYQNPECRQERKKEISNAIGEERWINARIIAIDKDRFSVKLSCLPDDMG